MSLHQTHGQACSVGDLVRAAQQGDRAAFAELYTRYGRMVHAIAVTRGSLTEADDVVQEVFLRALRQIGSLRSGEAFGAWLGTITRNTVNDLHRRPRADDDDLEAHAVAGTQHEEIEARAALDAIRGLPEAYRETVMMRLVEGMTGPEIADRTGLSPASVRVNLHRGMKLLRRHLEAPPVRRRA